LNGINPVVSIQLIRCYVIPRLMYGLDVILLTKRDLQKLSSYFTKLLKQIQHLPERTATSAVYLLAGQLPLEAELHKRKLTLYRNIVDNKGTIENDIAWRQLALKTRDSNSWFIELVKISEKYELPSPYVMLSSIPSKEAWKKLINSVINKYWIDKLVDEANDKTTLKFFNSEVCIMGKVHPVWRSCGSETYEVTRACVKSKLLCGVYLLQSDRAKFSKQFVSSLCPLCFKEPEDRCHFILNCSVLLNVREKFLGLIKECLFQATNQLIYKELCTDMNLLQVILDSSKFHFLNDETHKVLDRLTRGMCFALHHKRKCFLQ